jgi:hypothetical protein
MGQPQVVAHFFEGPFCNVQDARFVWLSASLEPFGDIRRDRHGGFAKLRGQSVRLFPWK